MDQKKNDSPVQKEIIGTIIGMQIYNNKKKR